MEENFPSVLDFQTFLMQQDTPDTTALHNCPADPESTALARGFLLMNTEEEVRFSEKLPIACHFESRNLEDATTKAQRTTQPQNGRRS